MTRIQGLPQANPSRFEENQAIRQKPGAKPAEFLETLKSSMGQVEQLQIDAQARVGAMLQGSGEDVHSAAIAVEKADLAFQLMLQVRNKIVQAYQEVFRMPF